MMARDSTSEECSSDCVGALVRNVGGEGFGGLGMRSLFRMRVDRVTTRFCWDWFSATSSKYRNGAVLATK